MPYIVLSNLHLILKNIDDYTNFARELVQAYSRIHSAELSNNTIRLKVSDKNAVQHVKKFLSINKYFKDIDRISIFYNSSRGFEFI